ncbi:putative mannitol dehydrogenase [Vitis vinifera]|uniref:Putative mannitol dehydrogenase n=1 Tax=Vitis vinifera TaxID=29760 RepID=A0A438FBG9_VITVI|nr:putative mannitol dehydrogenase [Vitis vinifera]
MAKSPEQEHPTKAFGWAASDPSGVLSPFKFSRRATGGKGRKVQVLYCGICHSDLHMLKNEWGFSTYPLVPENYCPKNILTYGATYYDGTTTYGGYSDVMVAEERYVVRFPENLPLDAGAPLLCAGITVYSPLQHFGFTKPGMHIVISTSTSKKKEATEHLGADSFLVSRDPDQMQAALGTMDGIIDTVSAVHPLLPLIDLLKSHGKLVMVGAPNRHLSCQSFLCLWVSKLLPQISAIVAGSNIGGMKETQEMIDFAGKHNITADVEVVPMDYVNTALERLEKADVRYRFVIDIGNTLKAA